MNDSFLADLDLVPKDKNSRRSSQLSGKYITTRKGASTPVNNCSKSEILESKHDRIISSSSASLTKAKRYSGCLEPYKLSSPETKPLSSTPKSERKNQVDENTKPVENRIKIDETTRKSNSINLPNKVQDCNSLKGKKRTSKSSAGNISKNFDASTKENTRQASNTSSSRDSCSQLDLKNTTVRCTSDVRKKSDILEKSDPVQLLSAIKDLVSHYTEQEAVKILRATQNLYVNSQSNLIKLLMSQTSEIVSELSINKNSGSISALIEENERMREEIFILRARNEILQTKVNEIILLKDENLSLKLKLKDLEQ
ncbi:uncharacterized protein LOC106642499 [Copidosoma floridanum]|uniref:uncharacterized protein LOC106642499 n=1 Tax=Copidosoma floridanum TaxID=29053 RepID=UPI0006C9B7C1|nr:uncharacterized protein LOC106642499 [Copidosoma floridanum]XP_014212791.1 uncharacterized protein LOC106642499 [Copidosoma floridanum]